MQVFELTVACIVLEHLDDLFAFSNRHLEIKLRLHTVQVGAGLFNPTLGLLYGLSVVA